MLFQTQITRELFDALNKKIYILIELSELYSIKFKYFDLCYLIEMNIEMKVDVSLGSRIFQNPNKMVEVQIFKNNF